MALFSRISLVTAFILTFPAVTAAQTQVATERHAFPQLSFTSASRGEQAIANLEGRLSEVAQWYGMTSAEFTSTLRNDSSASIDRQGRLFYMDIFPETANESDLPPGGAPYPDSQTFFLNSRPGANRVVYLDFDGHTFSGRTWDAEETVVSPPYDIDGYESSLDSTELEAIQNIWRQVAEDFAPFDINVTTQEPGQGAISRGSKTDQVFGTRVVITRDTFLSCGCGGVAYLRVFDDIGDYRKPAFVFGTTPTGVAEAITHVAGHNLGLNHDDNAGSEGHASASRSEYDIQLVPAYSAPLVEDDHGNSNASATSLDATGDGTRKTIYTNGMIHHRDDVDVFRFVSGAGSYSITVDPALYSPNLDIQARLFNSEGDPVASSNPISSLGATLSGAALPAGEYFLAIDGVGGGEPMSVGYTDYGSLGTYIVSGTFTDASKLQAPVASISAVSLSGHAPLSIGFDGSGSSDADGSIRAYAWNFGDGNGATGRSSGKVFYAPGEHTVSLQVTDYSGLTASTSVTVVVVNQPPEAVASASVAYGAAPLVVDFQGSNSSDPDAYEGKIVSWHWDFGDGGSSSQADPSYTYNTAGDFTPSLMVIDDQGARNTVSLEPVSVGHSASSQLGAIPAHPAILVVTGGSSDTHVVNWSDNASNEHGYVLERSVNGGAWEDQYRILGKNADSFADTELDPGTTYSYRVAAYNSAGNSVWSKADSAATPDGPAESLSLAAGGFRREGVRHANLVWTGGSSSQVDVYRDRELIATVANAGNFVDIIGGMGGGGFSYQMCEYERSTCSDIVTIAF
ncbi:PKD domain-containing protein [Haliea sp. E1-2-M8]|uniref:PKD domain-containing protein n=1 Tax=Haliea sp. E1-2-M8 TaxID=3064706 RepID=UPI00271D7C75|nr:PKD domain-containing protein [Haliea sp. E1-2-M8]MDO8861558.1 PKD domain-containing protein [Haliea sp. E1-2-M8]